MLTEIYDERNRLGPVKDQLKAAHLAWDTALGKRPELTRERLRLAEEAQTAHAALAATDLAEAARAAAVEKARAAMRAAWAAQAAEDEVLATAGRAEREIAELSAHYRSHDEKREAFIAAVLPSAREARQRGKQIFTYNAVDYFFPSLPRSHGRGRKTRHTKPRRRGRKA